MKTIVLPEYDPIFRQWVVKIITGETKKKKRIEMRLFDTEHEAKEFAENQGKKETLFG